MRGYRSIIRSALSVGLLLAAVRAVAEITPVLIDVGTPNERSGVLVAQEGQCVVLTAAHELDRRVSLQVLVNGEMHPAAVSWNGLRSPERIDVAVLSFSRPVKADCESLATPERIDAALRKSEGQLWLPPVGGKLATPSVRAKLRDLQTLTLSKPEADSYPLTMGVSGAAVVFDGLVVGILRGNTERDFVATRLDYLLRVAGDAAKLRRIDLATPAVFTPFDLGSLPAPVAIEVSKARELRERAELVSKLALDVEKRADEAALLAEEETKNGTSLTSNRKSYATEGGSSYYAGEVGTKSSFFSSITTTYPKGYGVLRTLSGKYKGEIKKCIWIKEGRECAGPMVSEYAPSSGSWRRAEVERHNDVPSGPARIVFRNGVILYTEMHTKQSPEEASSTSSIGTFGVYVYADGRRYEGGVNYSGGNGLGAVWDDKGKLIRAGLYKDGSIVD